MNVYYFIDWKTVLNSGKIESRFTHVGVSAHRLMGKLFSGNHLNNLVNPKLPYIKFFIPDYQI